MTHHGASWACSGSLGWVFLVRSWYVIIPGWRGEQIQSPTGHRRDLNPGRTDVFHNVVNCHRLRYSKAVISSLALCFIGTPEMTAHLKLARSLLDGSCMNWTLVVNIFSTRLEIITVSSLASLGFGAVRCQGFAKMTEGDHSSIAHLGYRHRHVTF